MTKKHSKAEMLVIINLNCTAHMRTHKKEQERKNMFNHQ